MKQPFRTFNWLFCRAMTSTRPERFLQSARLPRARTAQRPARGEPDTYRMLSNGKGGYLHLTDAVEGMADTGQKNPFGPLSLP